MGKVAIRIFEHVSAVSAEHKLSRLSHEQTKRMTAAWRIASAPERILGDVILLQHLIIPRAHERYCDQARYGRFLAQGKTAVARSEYTMM